MSAEQNKRSSKSGLPPGTLVHIGTNKTIDTRVTIVDYDEKNFCQNISNNLDYLLKSEQKTRIRWMNLDGIHDIDIMEKIADRYGIHILTMEDILNTQQRPKIEEYEGYTYIVAKLIYVHQDSKRILTEQVSIVMGNDFVITFQENEDNIFVPLVDRIAKCITTVRKMGTDFLVYSILDFIVDTYFQVLENLGEKIENVEDRVIANANKVTLKKIQKLRGEMLYMHKAIWPLREVLGAFKRGESRGVSDTTMVYLRDVYDHSIQIMDTIETYRDILSGIMDIYLSVTSNKMNETMKFLAIFSALLMPLTFIVGLYGMNFEHMPELKWKYGYPAVLVFMVVCVLAALFYFKKKKWM